MTNRHLPTAALILVAALSGSALAGTLTTPPLTAGDGNSLVCQITNVGTQPRTVTIEVFGFCTSSCAGGPGDGLLLDSITPPPVGPLQTLSLTVPDIAAPNVSPHVCRFTGSGGKKSYRATACAVVGGVPTSCVAAN
jgi:hypothetical protein